jgi:hypothetical protein
VTAFVDLLQFFYRLLQFSVLAESEDCDAVRVEGTG